MPDQTLPPLQLLLSQKPTLWGYFAAQRDKLGGPQPQNSVWYQLPALEIDLMLAGCVFFRETSTGDIRYCNAQIVELLNTTHKTALARPELQQVMQYGCITKRMVEQRFHTYKNKGVLLMDMQQDYAALRPPIRLMDIDGLQIAKAG